MRRLVRGRSGVEGGDVQGRPVTVSPTGNKSLTVGIDVAVRGERILAAALAAAGRRRFRNRIAGQAARYWSAPTGSAWEANSHWRNGIGDQAWLEVGDDHWKIYETFARALNSLSPNTVMEWGAGGGANAVAFATHAQRFIAADISQENLDECVRQVRATCTTPVETRRIDLACPEQATVGLAGSCDVFLCLYVIELTTGANAVRAILKIARTVLAPGGMALVQIKYHTSDRRTRGFAGIAYDRNLASTTTFTIEGFWNLAAECGLTPRLITLVPENRLDSRYAYYALTNPAAVQPAPPDEHLLDVKYTEFAATFNADVADAERRAARGNYISRREGETTVDD